MSEQNKITGEIHQIGETITFPSGFSKRLCVITYQSGEYENFLAIDFLKDKGSELDNCVVGQTVTISYNLRSNENPKKPGQWFTNPSAWKMERDEHDQTQQPAPERQHTVAGHQMPDASSLPATDDEPLPF